MAGDPILDFLLSQSNQERTMSAAAEGELQDTRLLAGNVVRDASNAEFNVGAPPPKETPGFFSSVATGAQEAGIIVGVGEYGIDYASRVIDGIDNDVDEDFSHTALSITEPDYKRRLEAVLAVQTTDPAALATVSALGNANNAAYANYLLEKYEEAVEMREEVKASGMTGYIIGMGLGIGLDIATAAVATRGAATAPALGRGVAVLGREIVTKSVIQQRLLAGARIGTLGVLEGSAEAYSQSLTDLNITDHHIWAALGLGGTAGTLLGFGAPRMLGKVFNKADMEKAEVELFEAATRRQNSEDLLHEDGVPQAAGAQATPEGVSTLGSDTPGKASGTIFAGKVLPKWIRNPKNWLADLGVKYDKLNNDHGLQGGLHFWRLGNSIYKSARLTAQEIKGQGARTLALSERIRQMGDDLVVVEEKTRRTYGAMMEDVFETGRVKTGIGNDTLLSVLPGDVGRKILGGNPPLEEFNHHADILARARSNTDGDRSAEALESILSDMGLSPEKAEKYAGHLKAQADLDDKFYMDWARRGVKQGLLDADEIRPGYRPQMWNRHQIMKDPLLFKSQMSGVFGNRPTAEFVNEFFEQEAREAAGIVEGEGEVALKKIIDLDAGETFDDWAKKNPELALEVHRQWAQHASDAAQDAADTSAFTLQKELEKAGVDSLSTMETRAATQLRRHTAFHEKLTTELAATKGKAARTAVAVRLGKLDIEIGKVNDRVDLIRKAHGDHEATLRLIKRRGTKAEKASIKVAAKKAAKSESVAAKQFVKKSVTDAVDEVFLKLTNNKSAFGLVPDELISGSRHFKHRTIDLGGFEEDAVLNQFLIRDARHARNSYTQSYGRQTAIREQFMPLLLRQGLIKADSPDNEFLNALKKHAFAEFDEDAIRVNKLGLPEKEAKKLAATIQKDRLQANDFFDRSFGEITRSDFMDQTGFMNNLIGTAQAATAAMVLGKVIASLFGDVALTAFAGGRLGTGLGGMLRTRTFRKILKEIGEDDVDTMLLLRGANVYDQSLAVARMDLDNPGFDVAGGVWAKINRGVADVATKEGWFNFMHQWNRFIRGTFGMDFAKQISRDMGNYDSLPMSLKQFYARHGVSKAEADGLASALESHGRKFMNGKMVVPDAKKWMENGLSAEYSTYQRLVRGAGDEAMIDPQIGDRPFLRHHAMGRLVMQFQSFTFTAAERYFAPLWQNLRINPRDGRGYMSVFFGMTLAAAGEGLRAYGRGQGEEWSDAWGTSQGAFDNTKAAWLRSPLALGFTGTAVDAGTPFSPAINQAFSAATGSDFKIADDRFSKLRQRQGMAGALVGPAGGLVNTGFSFLTEALEGDTAKVAELIKQRVPGVNVLALHVLAQMVEDTTDTNIPIIGRNK